MPRLAGFVLITSRITCTPEILRYRSEDMRRRQQLLCTVHSAHPVHTIDVLLWWTRVYDLGGTPSSFTDERGGHRPMLMLPDPLSALLPLKAELGAVGHTQHSTQCVTKTNVTCGNSESIRGKNNTVICIKYIAVSL